jgi:hypothetical protein
VLPPERAGGGGDGWAGALGAFCCTRGLLWPLSRRAGGLAGAAGLLGRVRGLAGLTAWDRSGRDWRESGRVTRVGGLVGRVEEPPVVLRRLLHTRPLSRRGSTGRMARSSPSRLVSMLRTVGRVLPVRLESAWRVASGLAVRSRSVVVTGTRSPGWVRIRVAGS